MRQHGFKRVHERITVELPGVTHQSISGEHLTLQISGPRPICYSGFRTLSLTCVFTETVRGPPADFKLVWELFRIWCDPSSDPSCSSIFICHLNLGDVPLGRCRLAPGLQRLHDQYTERLTAREAH